MPVKAAKCTRAWWVTCARSKQWNNGKKAEFK
jgi:hypothetical protein